MGLLRDLSIAGQLNDLPSGAWAVVGAVVAGLISWVGVVWQNRSQDARDVRARAALVADRTRDERRAAYVSLLLTAQKANGRVTRHFNEEQFNFGPPNTPGVEQYDVVWEVITGDYSETVVLAQLVASDAVRAQIRAVSEYLHQCVWAIAEDGRRPETEPHPIRVLERLIAEELDYRETSAGSEHPPQDTKPPSGVKAPEY